jgi:fructose-bisphosphate aldolase class II
MRTLREVLLDAKHRGVSVGHFNISDSTQFNAILSAAESLSVPVIVGVSEGEKNFIGLHNAVGIVRVAREQGREVYLNLDHGHNVDDCKEAIDAGFDSVMFDGSKLGMLENIDKTKEVVDYARLCGRDVLVEGELGYIGSSSKMLDAVPSEVDSAMTTTEQAREFVERTTVDILAPSIGNIHGMLKRSNNPELDIERIKEIRDVLFDNMFLVLHGGSGISVCNFKEAIKVGINIVHINTEIRRAYRQGIESGLVADTEQVAPYKYLGAGKRAIYDVVIDRLRLFNRL